MLTPLLNSSNATVFPPAPAGHGIVVDVAALQVGDEAAIGSWVDEVLAEHPEEANRYLAGEKKLQGVLVGFVMKKSKGRADPKRVNQLLSARGG